MYEDNLAKCAQEAGMALGNLSPKQMTRRERLSYQRKQIQIAMALSYSALDAVDKAIEALDRHPELEEFMETLSRAGI
jgi:GTP-sensing pleiotropic transcriptional regulator CodY